jgi:hypothetical protein
MWHLVSISNIGVGVINPIKVHCPVRPNAHGPGCPSPLTLVPRWMPYAWLSKSPREVPTRPWNHPWFSYSAIWWSDGRGSILWSDGAFPKVPIPQMEWLWSLKGWSFTPSLISHSHALFWASAWPAVVLQLLLLSILLQMLGSRL